MFKKTPPNYRPSSGTIFSDHVVTSVVDGSTIAIHQEKSIDEIYPTLPSPDNFSLDAQLSAGVDLQQVNSTILTSTPSMADVDAILSRETNKE